MWTMQVDETVSNLFKASESCLRSIDKLPVAAGNRKNALEYQLTFFARVDPLLAERLIHLRAVLQFKERFHGTLVSPGPDEGLVGAFAQNQFECAHNDRFTSPGLPGHHAERGSQFPV